ncbi:MAG: XRE family transcriptional regulator [Tepidisphaeraceae bacterium]|jgi:transcriptional regulator with XRE-family HTH domain
MEENELIEAQLADFGVRLKDLRSSRGWTLEELAERTGLSKPFLSRLEAGDRQPSIAVVLTLARTYGVSLGDLFERSDENTDPCVIVRGHSARPVQSDGLSYLPLSSKSRFSNLEPMRLTVSAQRRGDEMFQHEGEEWVYVLAGKLCIHLAGKTYDLAPGDSAHFDSRLPHRLSALGGKDAELILVACPLPEPAAQQRRAGNAPARQPRKGQFHERRAIV